MIRPTGGGAASGRKAALPSAEEMLGAMGQPYGIGPRATRGMYNMMDQAKTGFTSPFQGLPTSAAGADFETISLFGAQDTMQYYNPQTPQQVDASNQAGEAIATGNFAQWYMDAEGNLVDRSGSRKFYDEQDGEVVIPGEKGPQYGETRAPAQLSLVPTSSINPDRPRTVAAGYDKQRQVLTVVFRDGTYYNYYEVDMHAWQDFKSRVSKGQYIYKYLDFHPRGPADVNSLTPAARTALYKVARVTQLHSSMSKAGQYNRMVNKRTHQAPKPKKRK